MSDTPTPAPGEPVIVTFEPVPAGQTPDTTPPEKEEDMLAGLLVCMACQNEWPALVKPDNQLVTCPACHAVKGHMKYEVSRGDREWQCSCGNDLFRVTPDYVYCPNCGKIQEIGTP